MSQEKTDTLKLDAFSLKTKHQIYIGNARQMTEVADESVHCVVTSPPYVTTVMEKGQAFDYGPYRSMMEDVFREIWRTMTSDGRFCLNVADIRSKYFYDNEDGMNYRQNNALENSGSEEQDNV